jgi:hypothetical protein
MLSFALKCFLLYVVNQVKPPPSFGSWSNTLHLSPAIRPHGDLLLLLHPWWGKDCIPWCYLRCLCIHCERCEVSCLVGTNPHFFVTFFFCRWVNIVLSVDNIYTLAFVIIADHTWINLVLWVVFFLWGGYNNGGSREKKTLSQPLPIKCVSSFCHKGF